MRLLDVFQKEDYQPLERGEGFPQFYENGDRYKWWNAMDFGYRFWHSMCMETCELPRMPRDDAFEVMLMGGEL